MERPTQKVEQRRSPRHRQKLPVELIEGQRRRTLQTVDVSRHGLFIATDDPPRERYLLQLNIKIPSGALPATAYVARTVRPGGGRTPGVGVQFFALSAQAKERWDAFIFELSGLAPPPTTGDLGPRRPDIATFLIKLKNKARLLEFYEKNVARGGFYMATPVIKETGAEVGLVVIHPETEQEYFLSGKVERVCTEAPKGMEIKLPLTPERKAHFLDFVKTGVGPEMVQPAPPELRQQVDQLPLMTQKSASEDISIDIDVDEEAIEDSQQFLWSDVSESSGVLTFDISVHDQSADEADTDDLLVKRAEQPEVDIAPPPRKSSTKDLMLDVAAFHGSGDITPPRRAASRGTTIVPRDTAELYEMPPEVLRVSVWCTTCESEYGTIDLGRIGGPLGLLASRYPYWCKYEDQIVSVIRLNHADDRRKMLEHVGEHRRTQSVTLELAFTIADLSERPRCPGCGGDVRSDGIPKVLAQVLDEVRAGAVVKLEGVACPICREQNVVAGPDR